MSMPNRPDYRMRAHHLRNVGKTWRIQFPTVPDGEHGEIDIGETHILTEQERCVDMSLDDGERLAFEVSHYAGIVMYDAAGFCDKNGDKVLTDQRDAVLTSASPLVTALFDERPDLDRAQSSMLSPAPGAGGGSGGGSSLTVRASSGGRFWFMVAGGRLKVVEKRALCFCVKRRCVI